MAFYFQFTWRRSTCIFVESLPSVQLIRTVLRWHNGQNIILEKVLELLGLKASEKIN